MMCVEIQAWIVEMYIYSIDSIFSTIVVRTRATMIVWAALSWYV